MWGFTPPTEAEYERFLRDPVQSDASLWQIAWDGDEVAGQVRAYIDEEENARFGRLRGVLQRTSACVPPWRRRGLARALFVAASFPALRARGMQEAALGVDTENVTGALGIYERMRLPPRQPLDPLPQAARTRIDGGPPTQEFARRVLAADPRRPLSERCVDPSIRGRRPAAISAGIASSMWSSPSRSGWKLEPMIEAMA